MKNRIIIGMRCTEGTSLVEVMIALVVLLLVLTGLLQSALLSIDHNLRNVLRDEAVSMADQRMNGGLVDDSNNSYDGLRTIAFDTLVASATGAWTPAITVSKNFRALTKPYLVCWRITSLDAETVQLEVAVGWDYRKENAPQPVGNDNTATTAEYVHQITTLRRI